jgi:hypothetical protein
MMLQASFWPQRPPSQDMGFGDMDDFDISEEDLIALEQASTLELASTMTTKQNNRRPLPNQSASNPKAIEFEEEYFEIDLDDLESQALAAKPTSTQLQSRTSTQNHGINTINPFSKMQQVHTSSNSWQSAPSTSTSNLAQLSNSNNSNQSKANQEYERGAVKNTSGEFGDEIYNKPMSEKSVTEVSNYNVGTIRDLHRPLFRSSKTGQRINVAQNAKSSTKDTTSVTQINQPPLKKMKNLTSDIKSCTSPQSSTAHDSINKTPPLSKPNLSAFLGKASSPHIAKPQQKLCTNIDNSVPTGYNPAANTPPAAEPMQISRWPFVYLGQLQNPDIRPQNAVVKASVISVLHTLKSKDGMYYVKLQICDGSGTLDVEFSNEVCKLYIYTYKSCDPFFIFIFMFIYLFLCFYLFIFVFIYFFFFFFRFLGSLKKVYYKF